MSFISQLLMAFIIFGLVATISIGLVIALLGRKQKYSDAAERARTQNPSF